MFLERGSVDPELLTQHLVGALLDFLRLLAGLVPADFVLYFRKRIDALLQLVEFFLESLLASQEPDAQSEDQDKQHSNQSGPSPYPAPEPGEVIAQFEHAGFKAFPAAEWMVKMNVSLQPGAVRAL
ncbi:MAG: hypothetical protein WBZ19_05555 [Chthoniobacterales bacterium]